MPSRVEHVWQDAREASLVDDGRDACARASDEYFAGARAEREERGQKDGQQGFEVGCKFGRGEGQELEGVA